MVDKKINELVTFSEALSGDELLPAWDNGSVKSITVNSIKELIENEQNLVWSELTRILSCETIIPGLRIKVINTTDNISLIVNDPPGGIHTDFVVTPNVLTTIQLSDEPVKKLSGLFHTCQTVTHIDLSGLDITQFDNNIRGMFMNCTALTYVDLSCFDNYNVSLINNHYNTFNNTPNLTTIRCSSALKEILIANKNTNKLNVNNITWELTDAVGGG